MNCDRIARWYRWIEYAGFGRTLERRRQAFLSDLADARRVLALGDGDGRALAPLLAAAPYARVDYIDVSARMLELARHAPVPRPSPIEMKTRALPSCRALSTT